MKLIETIIDGDYTINKYDNGVIEKIRTESIINEVIELEPAPQPTNAEIQENQIVIMTALADMCEMMLGGGV